MNQDYLIHYVSFHLHTHVRLYTKTPSGTPQEEVLYPGLENDSLWLKRILDTVPYTTIPKDPPALVCVDTEDPPSIYCRIFSANHIYLIGPCFPKEGMEYLYNLSRLTVRKKGSAGSGRKNPAPVPKNQYAKHMARLIQKAARELDASGPAGAAAAGATAAAGEAGSMVMADTATSAGSAASAHATALAGSAASAHTAAPTGSAALEHAAAPAGSAASTRATAPTGSAASTRTTASAGPATSARAAASADSAASGQMADSASSPVRPVFYCSLIDLAECALLLYYWNGSAPVSPGSTYMTPAQLLAVNSTQSEHINQVWEKYNEILLNNMEHGIIHNPYNQEIREYSAVENGDVEEVKRIQKEDYTSRQGVLSPDPLRNEINMGIVIITLSRSAAARGGVSPEACYSLSDAAIQEMESCRDVTAVRHIARSAQLRYTMLARAAQESREGQGPVTPEINNRHISHCKDYIFTHLNRKLTVRQIADAIGLETNYLSALFHRCENITLKQYIIKEKINLAKNMLAYSPYSYIEIANYLGFSSQSHMGEQFRRATGMTMRQYRERYSKEDFLQDVVTSEGQA